jgi:hypothetical protein
MSEIAVPREALGARLNDTVTDGNCPWWLMESASLISEACVKALSGTAFAPVEEVDVFGVVPAVVPPFCEEVPVVLDVGVIAEVGGVRTFEEGVYWTAVVCALEPAEVDAEDEYELTAEEPLAPEEEFACTYRASRSRGCCRHCAAVSRMR